MARVSAETTAANAHDEAETLVDAIARVARDIEEVRREAGRMHVTAEILDDDGLDQWRIPRSDEVHIIGDADDDIAARRRAPRRPAAEDMMMSELGSGVL